MALMIRLKTKITHRSMPTAMPLWKSHLDLEEGPGYSKDYILVGFENRAKQFSGQARSGHYKSES
jgi:hypothetical protein